LEGAKSILNGLYFKCCPIYLIWISRHNSADQSQLQRSISIYDNVQALDFASAGQTSLLLLAASFVILALVYGLNRTQPVLWPTKH